MCLGYTIMQAWSEHSLSYLILKGKNRLGNSGVAHHSIVTHKGTKCTLEYMLMEMVMEEALMYQYMSTSCAESLMVPLSGHFEAASPSSY